MNIIEAVAIVNERASREAAYLIEQIDDEIAIAEMLGYTAIDPEKKTPSCTVWGRKGWTLAGSTGTAAAPSHQIPLPKWRRSPYCFELVARCRLSISQGDGWVQASAPGVGSVLVDPADHPTLDDAIRYAMCKAAIAFLTAERAASTST